MDIVDKQSALRRIDGDEELYVEIVQLFLEDAPGQIENLSGAVSKNDTAAAVLHSHSLKSAAANVGAERLREVALKIEMSSRESNLAQAQSLLPALQEEFALVQEYFE